LVYSRNGSCFATSDWNECSYCGAFSWAASYNYSLPPDKKLSDFGMEQQASIISDYYYLVNYGLGDFRNIAGFEGIIGSDLNDKYGQVLSLFLINPKERRVWL
jgi:hypothetical protein